MLTEKTVPGVWEEELMRKIRSRTVRAGILGLGYVGLPLAIEFAGAGVEVTGIDIDEAKIEALRRGESYILDIHSETVSELAAAGRLRATSDFGALAGLDTVNICVPTPLRKSKDPDISAILSAAREIAKHLHPGMLVILESTTYPGTTEEVILPLLQETGLAAGRDFFLAFSPERIDPGNPRFRTRNIPKVVGGLTPACGRLARAFYEIAIEKVCPVSGPKAAEMVKLLENTFRSVNIGLVNELCLMSGKLGVDIWEVLEAAATKPFGFMPFYPGPGLGGHCIPIDPHYLAWKARVNGFHPRFIELASEVNERMPEFVVSKAQAILNERGLPLKGSEIALLGITYKKNVNDLRESPALEILRLLENAGARVSYSDPFVPAFEARGRSYVSRPIESFPGRADLAILVTDHSAFDYAAMIRVFPRILDTRNAFGAFEDRPAIVQL